MTGLTKEELEQIARDAGCTAFEAMFFASCEKAQAIVNAVIDRAAAECEKQIEREKDGHAAHAVLMAKEEILALKINTGD